MSGRTAPSFVMMTVPTDMWSNLGSGYRRILFYGPDLSASSEVTGFVRGFDTQFCEGSTANNGYDFGRRSNMYEAESVYVRSIVDTESTTVSGSIRDKTSTYALIGGPLPGASSGHQFRQRANLAEVVGDWSIKQLMGDTLAITIQADGAWIEARPAETVIGKLTPHASGVNQFDLYIRDSRSVVIAYPLEAGGWQMFIYRETPGPMDDVPSAATSAPTGLRKRALS